MKNTFHIKKSRKAGLSPGTLPLESEQVKNADIHLIHYDQFKISEKSIKNFEDCVSYKEKPGVSWINFEGRVPTAVMEKIGTVFGLHPLLLEDIACGGQRPKVEEF